MVLMKNPLLLYCIIGLLIVGFVYQLYYIRTIIPKKTTHKESEHEFMFMKSPLFNAQFVRTLGPTTYQGAEIGECFEVAGKIKDGDREGWYAAWYAKADELFKQAHQFLEKKSFNDARYSFLRACTYYRAAYFFLEDNLFDPRISKTIGLSIDAFHQAIKLFEYPVRIIEIPYSDSLMLPAYLYINPNGQNKKLPIVITDSGGDSTKEEVYPCALEALSRGYHALTFEGPGQGAMLRQKHVPFTPYWENVVEKVVDYIYTLPEVDTNNIIYIGRSFAGFLAARAVTKEKRITTCIVDPGQFDQLSNITTRLSKNKSGKSVVEALQDLIDQPNEEGFMMKSRLGRFGAKNAQELIDQLSQYTVKGLADQITCPTMVFDNAEEYLSLGQAKTLYDLLTCKKGYYQFTAEEFNGGHCEPLIPRVFFAKAFAWVKENLR